LSGSRKKWRENSFFFLEYLFCKEFGHSRFSFRGEAAMPDFGSPPLIFMHDLPVIININAKK